jgi:hypothetical protein
VLLDPERDQRQSRAQKVTVGERTRPHQSPSQFPSHSPCSRPFARATAGLRAARQDRPARRRTDLAAWKACWGNHRADVDESQSWRPGLTADVYGNRTGRQQPTVLTGSRTRASDTLEPPPCTGRTAAMKSAEAHGYRPTADMSHSTRMPAIWRRARLPSSISTSTSATYSPGQLLESASEPRASQRLA